MGSTWLPFGVLRRPHGTGGEIFLAPFNLRSETLAKQVCPFPVRLVRGEDSKDAEISACRSVHEGFLVRFAGVESREGIAEAVGREVHLPRAGLVPLADGEFYVEDVVGFDVFDRMDQRLGRVQGIFWNGAQDVITIVADDGSERLLPVVAQFIHRFELAQRRLVVDFHD